MVRSPLLAVAAFLLVAWLVPPAAAGAGLQDGLRALEAGDHARAFTLLEEAGRAGDREAQYQVGLMLDRGRGVASDPELAAQWFRMAAERDHPAAQHALGTYHELGKGVGQDYRAAAIWYRRAAELGNAKAMRNLATLYLDGNGVAQDRARAAELYRDAAAMGSTKAFKNLAYLYYFGIGVQQDRAKAAEFFRQGAAGEDDKAAFALGLMHYSAEEIARDLAVAHRLFRRAAEDGHAGAQIYLGRMYLLGEAVEQDFEEAYFWLLLAEPQIPASAAYYVDLIGTRISAAEIAAARRRAARWTPREQPASNPPCQLGEARDSALLGQHAERLQGLDHARGDGASLSRHQDRAGHGRAAPCRLSRAQSERQDPDDP